MREELSQQFAERLREMEAEMTERTMKVRTEPDALLPVMCVSPPAARQVTHVERERELTVMTARRRRQVEGRMKNRDAEELAVQVVECEAELDRVRERNAEQVVALQEKVRPTPSLQGPEHQAHAAGPLSRSARWSAPLPPLGVMCNCPPLPALPPASSLHPRLLAARVTD